MLFCYIFKCYSIKIFNCVDSQFCKYGYTFLIDRMCKRQTLIAVAKVVCKYRAVRRLDLAI